MASPTKQKLEFCQQIAQDEPLLHGEVLRKCSRGGKILPRRYHVTRELMCLKWESTGTLSKLTNALTRNSSIIDIPAILRIQPGVTTARLHKLDAKQSLPRDLCFSIVLSFGKTIDILCTDSEQYDRWFKGLQSLVTRWRSARALDPEQIFLYQQWIHADANRDGKVNRSEIIKITHTLNHASSAKRAMLESFINADQNKDGELSFSEFCSFMNVVRHREEIDAIIQLYSPDQKAWIPQVWETFFLGQCHNPGEILALTNKYMTNGATDSYLDLCRYLTSPENAWFELEKIPLYQDMNLPLSNYFISTSHNTYLEGDQLQSNSSVHRYISVLLQSCRCVEIDIWDGDDGEPVVYHGHTLTTRIKFSDVIQAINAHAFDVSPFPLILSLENHCSEPQQVRMAAIMTSVFGDKIYTEEPLDHNLPSPNMLQHRILLKGKGNSLSSSSDDKSSESDEECEDKVVKKLSVAKELDSILFFKGKHFSSFEDSKQWPCNYMSSFSEGKVKKLCSSIDARLQYQRLHQDHVSRIYPSGVRIDSSNFNPLLGWSTGAQLVALNFQADDLYMRVNHGLFAQNGHSGYVLRPNSLRDEIGSYHRQALNLTIRVLSGQHLPKPEGAKRGEIIDPYVMVDVISESNTTRKTTPTVDNNGLNPVWNAIMSFDIGLEADLHFVVLTVMEKDYDLDDMIGFAALPLTMIREGYRTVPIYAADGTRAGPYEFATLFCHFTIVRPANT
ncbi:phospholipase C-eta2 [Thraustotheca clavata]|uniref:Phosphoinositide phospholipase C n=1 Tax=Thraustotheca clavata TaxID=74557 RepID=A0A1V9ZY66_9STRA|nr:phospholipase C-eta2 [Thraustotheca clavata]